METVDKDENDALDPDELYLVSGEALAVEVSQGKTLIKRHYFRHHYRISAVRSSGMHCQRCYMLAGPEALVLER